MGLTAMPEGHCVVSILALVVERVAGLVCGQLMQCLLQQLGAGSVARHRASGLNISRGVRDPGAIAAALGCGPHVDSAQMLGQVSHCPSTAAGDRLMRVSVLQGGSKLLLQQGQCAEVIDHLRLQLPRVVRWLCCVRGENQ